MITITYNDDITDEKDAYDNDKITTIHYMIKLFHYHPV